MNVHLKDLEEEQGNFGFPAVLLVWLVTIGAPAIALGYFGGVWGWF